MSYSDELKPCPFCGSEAELVWWGKPTERYWIPRCGNRFCCGRLTKKFSNVGKAIKFWNRRASDVQAQ